MSKSLLSKANYQRSIRAQLRKSGVSGEALQLATFMRHPQPTDFELLRGPAALASGVRAEFNDREAWLVLNITRCASVINVLSLRYSRGFRTNKVYRLLIRFEDMLASLNLRQELKVASLNLAATLVTMREPRLDVSLMQRLAAWVAGGCKLAEPEQHGQSTTSRKFSAIRFVGTICLWALILLLWMLAASLLLSLFGAR